MDFKADPEGDNYVGHYEIYENLPLFQGSRVLGFDTLHGLHDGDEDLVDVVVLKGAIIVVAEDGPVGIMRSKPY